ncbi:uncharacterized protein LOC111713022 isoform X2 [Eurytemora carolleeae]|uniref:uncharacterized protein LOC111713022 isoform X2 n=1 Tax=Eurytemora carolleeae TaxID=1294199 RepID=UPI000C767B46|nr:uncharacterized protein LOC111713022 isoform X2 [Eurytemora carolleeae]|eukprot:XP_023343577.1 uncharacterized protein LOC111713022 isoform X2 [Eurytemora affinis]
MISCALCLVFLFQGTSSKIFIIETEDASLTPSSIPKNKSVVFTKPSGDGQDYMDLVEEDEKGQACFGDVRILLGEKSFLVTKGKDETSPVKINGYTVSVEEYQQALAGEIIDLKNDNGDSVELKLTAGTITLDGDPITNVEQSVKSAMPFVL